MFVPNCRELQLPAVLLVAIMTGSRPKPSRYHPFISLNTVQTKMKLQNVTGFCRFQKYHFFIFFQNPNFHFGNRFFSSFVFGSDLEAHEAEFYTWPGFEKLFFVGSLPWHRKMSHSFGDW